MKFKDLKEQNLLDRFLFSEVAEDEENVKTIVNIATDEDVEIVGRAQTEKEERSLPQFKQVRLDVWAEDSDGNVYDTEVQQSYKPDLLRRMRIYSALLDFQLLKSGEMSYNTVNNSCVIMIAPFDLFGKGKYKYTFEMMCREVPGLTAEDGVKRIFLNTKGTDKEGISEELIEMLKLFEDTSENVAKDIKSERVRKLYENAMKIKASEEVGKKFMNKWEERLDDIEAGRKEGLAEGHASGLAEGEKLGQRGKQLEIAGKLKAMKLAINDIIEATGLTMEEVEQL